MRKCDRALKRKGFVVTGKSGAKTGTETETVKTGNSDVKRIINTVVSASGKIWQKIGGTF